MKIASITDVVTNSSSETYCMPTESYEEIIRGIVGAVFGSIGTRFKFDDFFKFELDFRDPFGRGWRLAGLYADYLATAEKESDDLYNPANGKEAEQRLFKWGMKQEADDTYMAPYVIIPRVRYIGAKEPPKEIGAAIDALNRIPDMFTPIEYEN